MQYIFPCTFFYLALAGEKLKDEHGTQLVMQKLAQFFFVLLKIDNVRLGL